MMEKSNKWQDNVPDAPQFNWGYTIFIVLLLSILGFITIGVISLFVGVDVKSLSSNVALIPIKGVITSEKESNFMFETATSSQEIIDFIEKANKNKNIRAIILEINSPGGSAVASEEIANALKKTNKTTVAWIREVGASGAYWVASASDYIIASRASITGSIGVISSYLEFQGLLEKNNITYQRLVAGEYKDIGSPFKKMTSEEKLIFQQSLDSIRSIFVSEVARNRNLNKKEVDKLANGLFYLGIQAKELGLVDQLGSKDEVISYIEKKENITVDIIEYERESTLLEVLSGLLSKQSFLVGKGIGSSLFNKIGMSDIDVTT